MHSSNHTTTNQPTLEAQTRVKVKMWHPKLALKGAFRSASLNHGTVTVTKTLQLPKRQHSWVHT
jgi:hypothetical protein